jgi:recombinational DNA repair protein RecR
MFNVLIIDSHPLKSEITVASMKTIEVDFAINYISKLIENMFISIFKIYYKWQ